MHLIFLPHLKNKIEDREHSIECTTKNLEKIDPPTTEEISEIETSQSSFNRGFL